MGKTRMEELFYELYASSKQHDSWQRYEMILELRELMKQPKGSGSDHFERAHNDEDLVETEVATDPIEIEHGTLNLVPEAQEENKNFENHEGLVMLEEEPISPLQQVHVSQLERGLQIHYVSPTVCEDSQYVVGCDELFGHQEAMLQVSHVKVGDELLTKSTDVTNNQAAHYLFDKMPLRMQSKRRHIKCHKSWRFKFKHRVASRESKAGFEVNMKHNQSKEMLLQLLLSGTHKKRQRKTRKYHTTWKFRFKNMDLQRVKTQLDTRHFIFRWNKQQLGCRVVMLHFKNKGRFRHFQPFSEMKQRVIVNVRKSFGYLMEAPSSKYKGLGCVVEKKKLRNVEDGDKQDKDRFSGDVGAKVFMASEELHLLQDVLEMVKEMPLKTSWVSLQVMRNTKLKFTKQWMFKFRKKKIDRWLGYDLIVAYLRHKKPWAKLRVREHDNLTWEEDASDDSWSRSRMKLGEAMITCKNSLEKSYDKNVEIVAWSNSPGRSEISCEEDAFGDQKSFKFRKFAVAFMDISTVAKTQGLGFVHVLHKDAVLDGKLSYLMGNMMGEDQKQQGDIELLVIVLECVEAKGGVGMDKKPFHLSLRNHRVWDPGG